MKMKKFSEFEKITESVEAIPEYFKDIPETIEVDEFDDVPADIFTKAVITEDFVYYINFDESDDNGSTKMFDKDMKLVSDNYHATNDLYIVVMEGDYLWTHEDMLYNIEEMRKDYKKDQQAL
jgi:hypothetical protein